VNIFDQNIFFKCFASPYNTFLLKTRFSTLYDGQKALNTRNDPPTLELPQDNSCVILIFTTDTNTSVVLCRAWSTWRIRFLHKSDTLCSVDVCVWGFSGRVCWQKGV